MPYDAMRQEMAWCDGFVLIGWDEPFAAAHVEAMSAGKPIVWALDGGIADLAIDGVHGFRVRPRNVSDAASAISRLLADRELRIRMGEEARRLYENQLTWSANAAATLSLLRQASDGAPRAGLESPAQAASSA
jgi:glycosyltransferase involved in cell wall biosynthesis